MVVGSIVGFLGWLVVVLAAGHVSQGGERPNAADVHRGRVITIESARKPPVTGTPGSAALQGTWIRGDVARQQ